MENEEIMMNETTEAMTDVEEPITETEIGRASCRERV